MTALRLRQTQVQPPTAASSGTREPRERGSAVAIRTLIKQADPEVVEEWKWRGVPVWSHAGGDEIDEKALKALIRAAVALNTSSAR
jgi:hypothetical protein